MEHELIAKNELIDGSITSVLIKFAIPFLIANLLQALYGAADLIIVGQFADASAVSAVATGSQVMQTITGIIVGLTTGGTVLIGQYLGAQKKEDVSETIGTMISIFTIIALILTGLMLGFTNQMTALMHAPMEAVEFTQEYIFICSSGIIFIVGYNAVSGILRGMGDSKTPLLFVLLACIINILLDLVLVGVFKMGGSGAAVATITSQAISLLLAILFLKRKGVGVELKREHLKLNKDKVSKIMMLGLPIATQDALINVSFLMITAIINTMGLTASAAVGVVEKVIIFTMLPPTAFSAAIATMVAQNMGALKYDRAKKCLKVGMLVSLVFGVACFIYSQVYGETLIQIFTKDPAVIVAGTMYLKAYTIDCIMVCFVFCLNGFFSGCGHSLFCMIHSVIATFIIRIPIAYVLSKWVDVTLYEIGLAAPIASAVSIIFCFIYFKSEKWKVNSIL